MMTQTMIISTMKKGKLPLNISLVGTLDAAATVKTAMPTGGDKLAICPSKTLAMQKA